MSQPLKPIAFPDRSVRVLKYLQTHPDQSVWVISQASGVDTNNTSNILYRLKNQALVESKIVSRPDGLGGKVLLWRMTEAGQTVFGYWLEYLKNFEPTSKQPETVQAVSKKRKAKA